jgi:hypothetical protein
LYILAVFMQLFAVWIRARHRLRSPNALQGATAAHTKATGLITNDPAG